MIIAPLDRKKVRRSVLKTLTAAKRREAQRKEWLKDGKPSTTWGETAVAFYKDTRRRYLAYRRVETVLKPDGDFYLCYGGDYTDGTGGFKTREDAEQFFYGGGR